MEKNKITIDSFKTILKDNNPLFLEIDCSTKLDITVSEGINTKLIIVGNSNYDLSVKLESDASLTVNSLNKNNSVNVDITLLENSNINYNHSTLSEIDSINNFKVNHQSNSSISNINNNGINKNDNKLFFNIDGVIPQNLHNIICNQNSKIINFNNGNSKIIPNLIIDSNDIIANHSAYIGEISEEELFYMQSRGIKLEDIRKLVKKAILLGKMDLNEEKEEFNKIVNEWW